jgi:hypothetical protein
MKYFGIAAILALSVTSAVLEPACKGQAGATSSDSQLQATPLPSDAASPPYKTRPIPQTEVTTPFAANATPAAMPLEFRSEDQMSDEDRALEKSAGLRISKGAQLSVLEFDKGAWSVQQLVCQALPDHLFLLFKKDNGPGDVSLFSAAIPRAGGSVHVIPIERRGFSLFSPATVNPITVAAFNRIRSDEPENKSVDWLATALCYAALAGARPAVSDAYAKSAGADLPFVFPPTLEVGQFGDSTVRFVDVANPKKPSEWALTFSSQGRLLKVEHFAAPIYAARPVPSN